MLQALDQYLLGLDAGVRAGICAQLQREVADLGLTCTRQGARSKLPPEAGVLMDEADELPDIGGPTHDTFSSQCSVGLL